MKCINISKSIAVVVVGIGLILAAIGIGKIVSNLPQAAPPAQAQASGNSITGMNAWLSNMGNNTQAAGENQARQYKRNDGIVMIVIGAIVAGVGLVALSLVVKPVRGKTDKAVGLK